MKSFILPNVIFMASMLLMNSCFAQGKKILPDISYYTVSSAYWISQISIAGDSLIIDQHRDGNIKDPLHYKIEAEEKKGDNFIIYLKKDPRPWLAMKRFPNIKPPEPRYNFGFFRISFSKDKSQLFELAYRQGYRSPKDAHIAADTVSITNKYYIPWYSKTELDKYLQYPKLQDADSVRVHKIIDSYLDEITSNEEKIRNTGPIPYQNWLNLALIKNQLSPLATMADFDKAVTRCHIKFPKVKLRYQPLIPPVNTNNKDKNVRIEEPPK